MNTRLLVCEERFQGVILLHLVPKNRKPKWVGRAVMEVDASEALADLAMEYVEHTWPIRIPTSGNPYAGSADPISKELEHIASLSRLLC